jgi:DNA-binding Xre family transcriptional regulator
MNNKSKVKLRISEILKEKNMTQTKLASLSGLSRNTISTLVHDPAQIRLSTLDVLCEALEVPLDKLIIRTIND